MRRVSGTAAICSPITDDVQITKGIHQISVGVWFQRVQDNEDTASRQLGQATFTSLTTFLQGTTSTFQVVPNANELGWRSLFGAWYVEDTIKLRPNLTLQVGLRDEFTTGWNEESGRAVELHHRTRLACSRPRRCVGNSVSRKNNAKHLLAAARGARLGPVWQRQNRRSRRLRHLLFADRRSQLPVNSLPPYNGSVTFTGALLVIAADHRQRSRAAVLRTGRSDAVHHLCAAGSAAEREDAHRRRSGTSPSSSNSSRNTVLRVAYVGSHGYHGLLSVDPNDIPAQICARNLPAGCTSRAARRQPPTGQVPQGAQYIPVGTRPNPYLGAGFFWYTEGNSSYNALQIDVTHRLSHGLQFRANYTWSKNLDMNSGLTGAQASNQAQMILDRNDLPRDWGPSALNVAEPGQHLRTLRSAVRHGRRSASSASAN